MKYSRRLNVQIGFIPYVEGWFNCGISVNATQYIISLWGEKPSDHLNRYNIKYLIKLDTHFSLEKNFSLSVIYNYIPN